MQIYKINLPSIANTLYVQADSKPKVRSVITERMTIDKVEGAELVRLVRSGAIILGDEEPVTFHGVPIVWDSDAQKE